MCPGVKLRGDGQLPLSAATSEPSPSPTSSGADRTAAELGDKLELINGKFEQTCIFLLSFFTERSSDMRTE